MNIDWLLQALWQPTSKDAPPEVYAVLDAARNERILSLLRYWGVRHDCLYEGTVPQELMEVAPYLVHLNRRAASTRELLENAWGNAWGLFVACSEDPERVRRHLRRFLMVQDEQGRRLYFRYYDPRVMRIYLPTCTKDELRFIFGPLNAWAMEGAEGATLLRYQLGPEGELLEQQYEGEERVRTRG